MRRLTGFALVALLTLGCGEEEDTPPAEAVWLVTCPEYQEIEQGQELARVEEIVGEPGVEESQSGPFITYSWTNPDRGFLLVHFERQGWQDDPDGPWTFLPYVVTGKSQSGVC
jgi:hypothetical protein